MNEHKIYQWLAANKINAGKKIKLNQMERAVFNNNQVYFPSSTKFSKKKSPIKKKSPFKTGRKKSPIITAGGYKRKLLSDPKFINVDVNPGLVRNQSIPLMINLNIRCPHGDQKLPRFGPR